MNTSLSIFNRVSTFLNDVATQVSLIFARKAGANNQISWSLQSGAPYVTPLSTLMKLLALPTNNRLGWEYTTVANALVYYDTAIITAVKSFIAEFQNTLSLQLDP